MKRFLLLAPLALAACGKPAPEQPAGLANSMTSAGAVEPTNVVDATPAANAVAPLPSATARLAADYVGKWRGVEGMFLDVAKKPGGALTLTMQYDLDHKGTYPATVTPAGLRFTRNGETLTLRPTDGDATGLKWLAGKKDCLTVKQGEGYCRV